MTSTSNPLTSLVQRLVGCGDPPLSPSSSGGPLHHEIGVLGVAEDLDELGGAVLSLHLPLALVPQGGGRGGRGGEGAGGREAIATAFVFIR